MKESSRSTKYNRAYLFTAATETKHGNLDQVICPVTVYISLIVSASPGSQSIHTPADPAPVLPADVKEWTSTKKKKEAVIRDRGSETIRGWRPHPGSPGPGM